MTTVQIRDIRWARDGASVQGDVIVDADGIRPLEQFSSDRPALDGRGLWLLPGFVDLSCTLPEPGPPHPANIESELQAAAANGFARVVASPDTDPVIDNSSVIEWIERRAQVTSGAQLSLLGALTQNLDGHALTNMHGLRDAGCVGVTQGRRALPRLDILRQCLSYAADLDLCVHLRPEHPDLSGGVAHDSGLANILGLDPNPVCSETAALAQILALVADSGSRVHIGRLSSAAGVAMLARAKDAGLPVTADVSIWNLRHTEAALENYASAFHLRPVLRAERDRLALCEGLSSGVIDALCSDHCPLPADAKLGPFADTAPGASSWDGFAAQLVALVDAKMLDFAQLPRALAEAPLQVLGRGDAKLQESLRHYCLIDPTAAWEGQPEQLYSRTQNSPLLGQKLTGRCAGWIQAGTLTLHAGWDGRLGV